MPAYEYRCGTCDRETSRDFPIGENTRTIRCGCGRPARQVLGLGLHIAAAATPTRLAHVVAGNARESRFSQDGPAYQRMRHRGLQPERIDGCSQLENRVGDQADIDHARAIRIADKIGGGKERVMEVVSGD